MAKLQIDIDVSGQSKVTQLDNSLKNLDKTTKTTATDSEKVAGALKKIGIAAAVAITISKLEDTLIGLGESLIKTSAQFEQFEAVLTTIEGSSSKAEDSLKWVEEFASNTPFNIEKVTESFVQLKAYGLEPTDGLLRTLGDTASAMGKDINQAVEAIADAVVGENERLKEFGIKANIIGDDIKYSWTNASGEMRTTIVQNNSEIIQSTLEAIFNSKYKGAMEDQKKTWNAMISNIQDKWTLFKKDVMDEGLFAYLKSIVTVVGDKLTEAFGNAEDMGKAFADYTIAGIKGVITGAGYVYDAFGKIGNMFTMIEKSAEVAFYGIQVISSNLDYALKTMFEGTFNFIIDGINALVKQANSAMEVLGIGYALPSVSYVDFGSERAKLRTEYTEAKTVIAADEFQKASTELFFGESGGDEFASNLVKQIDDVYADISTAVNDPAAKEDFGEAPATGQEAPTTEPSSLPTPTNEQVEAQDNATQAVEDTNNALDDLKETFVSTSGDDDVYTVFTETQGVVEETTETLDDFSTATENVEDSLDNFIFKFENTFINSLESSAKTLYSVGSDLASYQSASYEQALNDVLAVRDDLINNPLDTNIAEAYSDAYNQFISSTSDYLGNTSKFTTAEELQFASVTAGVQTRELQSTAMDTYDVLESMNDLLFSINQAYEDGILTEEEKATIAGVADDVNEKNEVLLGHSGVLVPTVDDLNKAINEQEYYNNDYLAKSEDLGDIGKVKLTSAGSFHTYDYTSSKKLDENKSETNTVGNFVSDLMGAGTSGISLDRIGRSLPQLSVDTGLEMGEISNVKVDTWGHLKTHDNAVNSKVNDVKDATEDANIKGTSATSIDDLRLKKETKKFTFSSRMEYFEYPSGSSGWNSIPYVTGETSSYEYYANGGFTGKGIGERDSTGYKQAGIVHEDEWVAPKWMIENNRGLFNVLEKARLKGFSSGGFTSKTVTKAMNGLGDKTEKYMFILVDEMKRLNRLMRSMSNGGESLFVEVV